MALPVFGSVANNPPGDADPQYLAFLRNLGLQQSNAWAHGIQQSAATQGLYANRINDLGISGQIAQRNILGGMESRGLYRSGETGQRVADQAGAQARAMADLAAQRAASLLGIRQGIESTAVDLARQRAEQDIALQQRNALKGAATLTPGG